MSPIFRSGFSVLTLLAGAAFLASCGGGGSGPALPRATATPSSTSSPTGCDATTYSPNYISTNSGTGDGTGDAGFTYWRHFPITVYIAPSDSATRAATIAGFNQWVSATGGRASYSLVSGESGANLSVSFAPNDQPADSSGNTTVGLTTVNYSPSDNHIASATMQLFILNSDGSGNASDNANGTNQSIAAHEFGHALGIGPHSLDGNDLMYYLLHSDNGVESVTTRDLNTLKTIYCNNFPTGSALERKSNVVEPLKTLTLPPLRRPKS